MNTNKKQEARGKREEGRGKIFFISCFLFLASCFLLLASDSYAADLKIGRMKVSIMPEYDSPDVLVVYEGKFTDKDAFPNQVIFTLPKGVTKLTDVCSLSPAGQHFCQLYDIVDKGEYNETSVKLPYSDFFIDFKYSPFKVKSGRLTRDFEYIVKVIYPIDMLEITIQEPLRTENFEILPKTLNTTNKKGFKYHNYKLDNIKSGDDIRFRIKYIKDNIKPSVDIKFSTMSEQGLIKKGNGILLLSAGIIILITVIVIRRLNKKESTKKEG